MLFFKTLLLLFFSVISSYAYSKEDSKVCEVRPPTHIRDLASRIQKKNCQEGDVLFIRDFKMGAQYKKAAYKRAAAHACDFSKPMFSFDDFVVICFYQGFVREARNPDHK